MRAARLLFLTAYRTAPVLAIGAIVLAPVAQMIGQTSALWLKVLANAVVRGDEPTASWSAAAIAGSVGLTLLAGRFAFELRQTLADRVRAAVERDVMCVSAGLPGLEHHERPEYHDNLQMLLYELPNIGSAMNFVPESIGIAGRFVITGVLLVSVHPLLLLLPLFGLPSLWTATASQKRVRQAQERTAPSQRLSIHFFQLGIDAGAAKELRVSGARDELRRRHVEAWWQHFRAFRRAQWIGAAQNALGSLGSSVGFAAAIAFTAWRAARGDGTPGDVLLAVALASQVQQEVSNIRWQAMFLQSAMRAARRFLWFREHLRPVDEHASAPAPARIRDCIELRGVSFTYPGTDAPVLEDVDLTLRPGSVVALVGDNGAGKTTLVKLLCRFYEPTAGTIRVDGTDLRSLGHEDWRASISAAFQDFARPELLVRESVGIGRLADIDDEEAVVGALSRAGASGVADLSAQLGKRWTNGVELSTGQWQKLAMGRAVMRREPLLCVFDEPTASLDAQTEHALFERFAASKHPGTVTVLVSHRFSTVRIADHIVVVDGGRIVQQGSHEQLMAAGGLYAELYALQASAYE